METMAAVQFLNLVTSACIKLYQILDFLRICGGSAGSAVADYLADLLAASIQLADTVPAHCGKIFLTGLMGEKILN